VATTPDELVAATRQAIADATAFDARDINRNFNHDYEAYVEVKWNLGRLVASGQLRLAMQLAPINVCSYSARQEPKSREVGFCEPNI
jgi:hypothetical protein